MTGFIPLADCDATDDAICDCVKCEVDRAAWALQTGDINCQLLASADPDLLSVVLAWEKISEPMRKVIGALAADSASQPNFSQTNSGFVSDFGVPHYVRIFAAYVSALPNQPFQNRRESS